MVKGLGVHPDAYLDARRPAWRHAEAKGQCRYYPETGLVVVGHPEVLRTLGCPPDVVDRIRPEFSTCR